MLRDQLYKRDEQDGVEITVPLHHAISTLLNFIDKRIVGFTNFYKAEVTPDKENFITSQLVNYFNAWINEDSDGYSPFSFAKHPAQRTSAKEIDIGVYILNPSAPTTTIFEFEAKRLSETSNNSEYVFGDRGGIERFKRNHHARHLSKGGMFGYVQSKKSSHWIEKINEWITQCCNNDDEIDWKQPDEKLSFEKKEDSIETYLSTNTRIGNSPIQLTHFFINLSNEQTS